MFLFILYPLLFVQFCCVHFYMIPSQANRSLWEVAFSLAYRCGGGRCPFFVTYRVDNAHSGSPSFAGSPCQVGGKVAGTSRAGSPSVRMGQMVAVWCWWQGCKWTRPRKLQETDEPFSRSPLGGSCVGNQLGRGITATLSSREYSEPAHSAPSLSPEFLKHEV